MTGYLLGLLGAGILWSTLFEGGARYAGADSSSWWTWPRVFFAAGIFGLISGVALTWVRRLETYRHEAAGLRPWLDDAALEMKAVAEAERDIETCRLLAAELRAEAERRQERLPRDLERFVQRYRSRDRSRPDV